MASPENFGNYLLKGIEEIAPAARVPWDFSAPAWPYLLGFTGLCTLYLLLKIWQKWRAAAYRRRALTMLAKASPSDAVQLLPSLLKHTAILAFGREAVAALYGDAWLNFLDQTMCCNKPAFNSPAGRLLIDLAYQDSRRLNASAVEIEALLHLARQWISTHRRTSNA